MGFGIASRKGKQGLFFKRKHVIVNSGISIKLALLPKHSYYSHLSGLSFPLLWQYKHCTVKSVKETSLFPTSLTYAAL